MTGLAVSIMNVASSYESDLLLPGFVFYAFQHA